VSVLDLPLVGAGGILAYIGPGAGLEQVGYALTLLLFGITASSAVLLWPFYALLRWLRGGKKPAPPAAPIENVPGETSATNGTEQ
jgi:hypothetical protein